MSLIADVLQHNADFVARKEYEPYQTDRFPNKKLVIVTCMVYREHDAIGIAERTGAGVYYGAAATEAQAFRDGRVMVIGGGNSSGQTAMHLSRFARDVQIVVRRSGLEER